MTKKCQITGKKPMVGNNRSHAMNATKRRFLPNISKHRCWISSKKHFITLFITAKGLRIIDKKGIETILQNTCFSNKIFIKK